MRAAALPPLIAFLLALLYLSIYPLFDRVPPWLFWLVVVILFVGTVGGLVKIVRAVGDRRSRLSGGPGRIAWPPLIPAVAMELICAWMLAGMVVPWL
ncbi:MAG TPA: hypothetical protein VF266_17545 [Thermoanaerobaculia bacterium]